MAARVTIVPISVWRWTFVRYHTFNFQRRGFARLRPAFKDTYGERFVNQQIRSNQLSRAPHDFKNARQTPHLKT